jgi:transposase
MSMKPQPIPEIPPETIRVVRAVFPKGNMYIHLRDTLGTIYQDELFADLFPGIHASSQPTHVDQEVQFFLEVNIPCNICSEDADARKPFGI